MSVINQNQKIKKIKDFPIILIETIKIPTNKEEMLVSLNQQRSNLNKKYLEYNYAIQYGEFYTFYENLYETSLGYCRSILEQFSIREDNSSQPWCYYSTENDYSEVWHNHLRTSTINLVYYLNMSEGGGTIKFSYKNKVMEYIPNEYDMLIFPNFLNHCPIKPIGDKPRISINLEIKCEETSDYIFKQFLN